MSHLEQLLFLELVADANHDLVAGGSVVEVGSEDGDGSMRRIFTGAASYQGHQASSGVEAVGTGSQVDHVDVALSRASFGHDPHWPLTFATMVRMTRPGGVVAFSCAGAGRPVRERDLRAHVRLGEDFVRFAFWRHPTSMALLFVGVRSGDASGRPIGRLPDGVAVTAGTAIHPRPSRRDRAIRLYLPALGMLPSRAAQRLAAPSRPRTAAAGEPVDLIAPSTAFGGGRRRPQPEGSARTRPRPPTPAARDR